MKKNESNAIEVDFTEVIESPVNQDVTVKPKKASLKILTKLLQNKAKGVLKNKARVVELVTKALSFCKKLGNISFLKKWFLDVPRLCDMLIDTVNGVYKNTPYSSLVMVVIAIIYAVSPIDILPDAIPIAGLIDDAAILKIVLDTIRNDLETYADWKENQKAL